MSKLKENPVLAETEVHLLATDVVACIEHHRTTVKAILGSYDHLLSLLDDGLKLELETSIESLKSAIENLPEADFDNEPEFEELFTSLQNLGSGEIEADKLLTLCDNDDILNHLQSSNPDFVGVKVFSQDAKDKIKQFLLSEIYPHYNEQSNILF
jgi:hypothetical protein